jgi:RTX calcium-binding nonapeptide repeat (4 copies)
MVAKTSKFEYQNHISEIVLFKDSTHMVNASDIFLEKYQFRNSLVLAILTWVLYFLILGMLYPRSAVAAGAPRYLHFGPGGLCTPQVVYGWGGDGIMLDENARILAVKGRPGEDYLQVEVLPNSPGAWDDELQVTLTTYGEGQGEETSMVVPLYDTSGTGGIGGITINNTPRALYLKRIEFQASMSEKNSVLNDSRVPMYARGWFADITNSPGNGFIGGAGPDCVEAVTGKNAARDNLIDTRGGSDFVRTGFGDDRISGGEGDDTIEAGSGDDKLRGRGGIDLLRGAGGSDCYSGSNEDHLRDVMDDGDSNFGEFNEYAAEPGIVDGVNLDTIEIITEENPFLVVDCI